MALIWTQPLSALPLCVAPEACPDQYMVNAVAISDDGSRMVAGTYYQHYVGTTRTRLDGKFGTYCYDTAGTGTRLFADEFQGDSGIYAVAISGDGAIAAGGGLLKKSNPKSGLLRAFDVGTHGKVLDKTDFPNRVNSVSLSNDGGVLAAVAESTLYVFFRAASGLFSAAPTVISLDGFCQTVAVHPSGEWLAVADEMGIVYLFTIRAGVVQPPAKWTALEPTNPALPGSSKVPVKFNCVSVARTSNWFVAVGDDFVYLFTTTAIQAAVPAPVGRYTFFDAAGHHNVRFAAISNDGSFVTAVVNDADAVGNPTGRLAKLSLAGGVLNKDWDQNLHHAPNSTSIDSSGTRITAADGFPDKVPGTFYLFNNAGIKQWEMATTKMAWPMFISANGSGIGAGNDNNTLFFFTP